MYRYVQKRNSAEGLYITKLFLEEKALRLVIVILKKLGLHALIPKSAIWDNQRRNLFNVLFRLLASGLYKKHGTKYACESKAAFQWGINKHI